MVQMWANGSTATRGIGLRASSETDNTYWKRFNSGNASSNKPVLSVTYNSYPNKPTGMQINGVAPSEPDPVSWTRVVC